MTHKMTKAFWNFFFKLCIWGVKLRGFFKSKSKPKNLRTHVIHVFCGDGRQRGYSLVDAFWCSLVYILSRYPFLTALLCVNFLRLCSLPVVRTSGIRFDSLAIKSKLMIIELKRRRSFPSLGMCETAAYDVKCDVTGLKPVQFSVPRLTWPYKRREGSAYLLCLWK